MRGPLNLDKLVAYARTVLKSPAELQSLTTSPLAGGYVSAGVYRHDLVFRLEDGQSQTLRVVQKFAGAGEARVLQLVSEVAPGEAFPTIIDASPGAMTSADQAGHWFITPFYEGSTLAAPNPVPVSVIASLARMHVRFRRHAAHIDWLDRVDARFFRRTFANALASLERVQRRRPDAAYAEAHHQVEWAGEQAAPYAALEILPATLTHGDVHGGNIIQGSDGKAMLVDWGNARIAPAMLDVANMIQIHSPSWQQYLDAWQDAGGAAMDEGAALLGYYWATIMVNLQYLPWAVDHLPAERVQAMAARVCDGTGQIIALKPGYISGGGL